MEDTLGNSESISLFARGGVVMIILLGLSIFATAVVLFKAYQFWKERALDQAFVEPALAEMKNGDPDKALAILKRANNPLSRVMESALMAIFDEGLTPEKREAEIQRVGNNELYKLESYTKGLEMVAHVAPLLGLLGTVVGMIEAFSKLEGGGARVDPSVLAGGIWEALLTTVGGLTVAIPTLAAYYVIDALIERIRNAMKDAATRVMAQEASLIYSGGNSAGYPDAGGYHHDVYPPQSEDMAETVYAEGGSY